MIKVSKITTPSLWSVYVIFCSDNSLYTGITTNIERRFQEHLTSKKGAKYFRGRKPLRVVYAQNFESRSLASKRESAIKRLSTQSKRQIILHYQRQKMLNALIQSVRLSQNFKK
ncbi:MAG: GIY-YIG nuclease family protein [Pseudomonadota bacterium]